MTNTLNKDIMLAGISEEWKKSIESTINAIQTVILLGKNILMNLVFFCNSSVIG